MNQNKIGQVIEVVGNVTAKDKMGNEILLIVGDEILTDNDIVIKDSLSKIVLTNPNGELITLIDEGTHKLPTEKDEGVDHNYNEIANIQKQILEGNNLADLEETASGGSAEGQMDSVKLSSDNFTVSGSISNVFETFPSLENSPYNIQSLNNSLGNNSPIVGEDATIQTDNITTSSNIPNLIYDKPIEHIQPTQPDTNTVTNNDISPNKPQDNIDNNIPNKAPESNEQDNQNPNNEITPQPPTPNESENVPTQPDKPKIEPQIDLRVKEIKPVIDTNLSNIEDQLGLESRFFYLGPKGEAYISHAEDITKGWTLHVFDNIDQAIDYASQTEHDATYQVKKIDFQAAKDEDLALNKGSDISDSPLARFLGDNAHNLKETSTSDYAQGKEVEIGTRALNMMEGYVFLEQGKEYKFKSESDDGIRIQIGDKILFNDEKALQGHHDRTTSAEDSYSVEKTGFYKMNIAHYDIGYGNATMKLFTVEDGKEVVVGDYKNGGIPVFTDISGLAIVDGQVGKIVGYQVDFEGSSNLDPNEIVTITKTSYTGDKVEELGEAVVDQNGSFTLSQNNFNAIPNESDTFKVDHIKDGKVVVSDITSLKDSGISSIAINNMDSIKVNSIHTENDTVSFNKIDQTTSDNNEISPVAKINLEDIVDTNHNISHSKEIDLSSITPTTNSTENINTVNGLAENNLVADIPSTIIVHPEQPIVTDI